MANVVSIIIVLPVIAILGIAIGLSIFFYRKQKNRSLTITLWSTLVLILLYPVFLMGVAYGSYYLDGRVRTYKAFFDNIEVGDTRDDVFVLLDKHYLNGGKRLKPRVIENTAIKLSFFMNPESLDSAIDCEGIFLTMEAGCVTHKAYVMD